MARIRTIKPEFWKSEAIACLPISARLTFIGLWTYVDDNGVGLDNEKLIVAELFPLEENPLETLANVSRDLQKLSDSGRIVRYTISGKRYLAIRNWAEHQKIDKPGKPRYPEPEHTESHVNTGFSETPTDSFARVSRECRDTPSPGAGNREQGTGSREQGEAPAPSPADAGSPPAAPPLVLSPVEPPLEIPLPVAVVAIPTNTGDEFPIYPPMVEEFERAYPAVDVLAQLRAMRAWSVSNPTNRKTRAGMLRFVNGWLAKEQNKPRRPDAVGTKGRFDARDQAGILAQNRAAAETLRQRRPELFREGV